MPQTSTESVNIADNLAQIQHNILVFCEKHHRSPQDVQLLAVSKTKPAESIRQAFNAGQLRFGENYLQESIEKIHDLSDLNIEWHFIGAIQSNKTREIAENFAWVHSVDRLKIAKRLSQQRPESLPALNICLEVNISQEASKSGFSLSEQRETFAKMKHLLLALQKKHPQLDTLSMGMSNDMEAAIAEGSTMLRIGTAIFGARNIDGL